MSMKDDGEAAGRISEALRIPWVRSSLILGAVIVAVGVALIIIFKVLNLGESSLFADVKAFVQTYGLLGIFLATVLAGTIIPVGSPALVAAAASFGLHPAPLVLVAALGFTVGMVINYGLAYGLGRPYVMRKVGAEKLKEISSLWSRWGWILYVVFGLIPVLPVEFLSLFCGLVKARFDVFLVLTFIPRLVVFMLLAYFGFQVGGWLGII